MEDWHPEVADSIAQSLDVELSPAHWEVIHVVRRFYTDYGLSPTSRVTLKLLKEQVNPNLSSILLMQLFGGRDRRHLAPIAGLPKPPDCD